MKTTIAAFLMLSSLAAFGAGVVDVKVKALDGFGGDLSSVLTRCQTKAGSEYDAATLTRDVTALKETKEFDSIRADARAVAGGVEVVFQVKRKMRFHAPLVVKGATFFKESKIAMESGLKDGELYGEGDLAEAAGKVRAAYRRKHFPDVKVTPVPEVIPGGNDCTMTFLVDEGKRLSIRRYRFLFRGLAAADVNHSGVLVPDGTDLGALRAAIGVHPWWNPVGWFTDAPVSSDELAASAPKVEDYFRDLGYLDAKVGVPERQEVGEGEADVVYCVRPGIRYKVGAVSIAGLSKQSEASVRSKCALPEPGETAGWKALADAARRIEVAVGSGDSGLADTQVAVRYFPREEDPATLDVVFKVDEGVPVVINQVEIQGNDYTKDNVIRREIRLSPGDRMHTDIAENSKRRIENLHYFSRVNYSLRKTDLGKDENGAEYRDLVYEVEEHSTGSFMFGVGASSIDSVFASAEIQQSNFDLFAPSRLFRGGGQKARLYAQVGPRIQTYEAELTEPWLFGRQLELTVGGYRRLRWYDDYDIIRSGASAALSYPLKVWNPRSLWSASAEPYMAFGRFGARLSGEFIQFDDIDRGVWEYKGREVSLVEEDRLYGDAFEPVAELFWTHDTRNTERFTSNGAHTHLFVDLAPAGDNEYWRVGARHRSYFTPWRGVVRGDSWLRGHVLMLALRAETIDGISDDVPIYNRLFLGGPKSVRGIEYRGVSPYARKADGAGRWDPWGGQTLFCANVEYTVPVFSLLRLAAFSDFGSVSADAFDLSDDFAWTAGLGVRIDVPSFPIRLDFGIPIEKPEHAKKESFSFTVGFDF